MAELKRTIGEKTLLLLIFNAIIGTGIFFLPAIGAAIAGPASLISWIIMIIIAIIMSLCFAEMVSLYPKSGSVYEYVKKAYGELPSFLVGWIAWVVANITIAMLIVGSILYILPNAPFEINIGLALFFILFFNFINYRGINYSTKLLLFFGVTTIAAILILIFPGIFQFDGTRLNPFFVLPNINILLAVYFISETFFGWESACYLTEEVKNARKVVPKTLVKATLIISLLSLGLVTISLGAADWKLFGSNPAPLSFLASVLFNDQFGRIFSLFIFIPLIGTAASWVVSSPRLLFAMSRDKVLPTFDKVHHKHQTPHKAILFQTLVTIFVTLVGFGNYFILLSLLIPLVVIMYSAFLLSFIKIRLSKPSLKRPFRAPFGVVVPGFVIVFNIFLLAIWLNTAGAFSFFILNIFFIIFGIPLYLIIKLQTDQKFVEKFYNMISFVWDYTFPIWYGDYEKNKIVRNLKINKNSAVLDFGCGTGFTTIGLAKYSKLVVGVDISEKQLKKAFKKAKNSNLTKKIIFIKENDMKFTKNSFDAASAVGVLEHLDNPSRQIKKMMTYLKKGGRFSFLSFGKSFTIPAPENLKNEEDIRKVFKGLNVDLHIKKEVKKFTEYYYIWGRKK